MNKKMILGLICILGLLILSIGCSETPSTTESTTQPESTSTEIYDLKLSTLNTAQDNMNAVVLQGWANWLDRESDGRIKVTIYPSCQLAAAADQYDAARTGIADISDHLLTFSRGRFPISDVTELPLLFKYPAALTSSLTQMELYNKYPQIQAEYGDVKVLAFHATEPDHIFTREKLIQTQEDFDGMIINAVGSFAKDFIAKLGGASESLATADCYDAMSKSVIDGLFTNYTSSIVFKNCEVSKYSTEFGFGVARFVLSMNLDTFNSMPSDLQELLTGENAMRLSAAFGYQFDIDEAANRETVSELLEQKGGGIYILPDDERAKWIEIIQPTRDEWLEEYASEGAEDILKDAEEFVQMYSYENYDPSWIVEMLHDWGAPGY